MEKHYRMLYPARVCLISSRHGEKDNIMAASWVFPLSADPPMFGVGVAPKRFSYSLIKEGKAFAINLPVAGLEKAVDICGNGTGKDTDRFADAGLTREEGNKVPLIKECSASIECELVDQLEVGDHIILVGKAINFVKRNDSKGIYQSDEGYMSL